MSSFYANPTDLPKGLDISRLKVILFDVNETLLDLSEVEQAFGRAFEQPFAFRHWFSQLLHYSLVDTITENFHDFRQIGEAAMAMTSQFFDKAVSPEQRQQLLNTFGQLPPHPDCKEGLKRLKAGGFRLAALTNSPAQTLHKQMAQSGLDVFFDAMLSVEATQRYKPHPAPYQLALAHLEVQPNEALMVTAHGWDIAGASHAGLYTAFLARKGQALYPLTAAPALTGSTLVDLAGQLEAKQRGEAG
ncbi:haloacid dehalogenase type II [Nibrella viscosa]|uniref:Haloacid dehalogenase type II n=1 Tax=Nibrella viscosa TaxID=1084524 RepID=A0ABP8K6V4_9BACT